MPSPSIRAGSKDDRPLLEAMLYEAFLWSPLAPHPDPGELRDTPEFSKLLESWGTRRGDTAVIAEMGSEAVGAAWYRYWTRESAHRAPP